MKKSLIIVFLAFVVTPIFAVDMMHLLQGGYDAKVLTTHQMDSILNPAASSRYQLEHENPHQLFRHSFFADYYLVDTQRNTRVRICDEPIRDAKLSSIHQPHNQIAC